MPPETEVIIYFGPLSGYMAELAGIDYDGFLELVLEIDDANRHITHTHVVPGQEQDEEDEPDPIETLVAFSGDFASLNEHVISNFVGQVRHLKPAKFYLHNPPARVHQQLERAFKTEVRNYEYPEIKRETLRQVNDGFANHLQGQEHVKESLLAGLYPLATSRRTTPVVMMFYGPSGVGKTETARFVNELLGGELLRKQFSMFHTDKFASYLFGGKHSEPSFARDLLDRESGVVLLDEFDKANPVFHSAFYQVFDEGVFEDKNYKVSLGPTLIICTSNYASESEIQEALGDALFSRFDTVVRFDELTVEQRITVAEAYLDERIDALDAQERAAFDEPAARTMVRELAANTGNVRRLTKVADELIALMLVRALFEQDADVGAAVAAEVKNQAPVVDARQAVVVVPTRTIE